VGEWLDSIKFAKAKWSRQSKWATYNVNSIIRRTIYRGFETNRVKVEKRKLRTGKSQPVWNDEDKIQTRESPHLRIVSDYLWYMANEVVDKRRVFQKPVRGAGHPLRGTTRQRRGLLAGVFTCGVCGLPMYSHGKTDGVFRCSGATELKKLDKDEKKLVAALPTAVAGPLRQAATAEGEPPAGEPAKMLQRTLVVNAFAEPQLVKHACVIVQRRLEGKTYKEIAKELDLTKDHIQNCARITKLMEEAGIPEPYHRLTEKPARVARWCSKHWLKAGDRKGGGKRRRAS
jgi:hypothetical protein